MELWIRSQDRECLIKCNYDVLIGKYNPRELTVITDEKLYKELSFKIWINNMSVGMYKTKERALEVLDEIQGKITQNECLKSIMPRVTDIKGEEEKFGALFKDMIYQMPKE